MTTLITIASDVQMTDRADKSGKLLDILEESVYGLLVRLDHERKGRAIVDLKVDLKNDNISKFSKRGYYGDHPDEMIQIIVTGVRFTAEKFRFTVLITAEMTVA